MGVWDTISEGFVASVADRLQKYYDGRPEKAAQQLARGNKYPFPGPSNYSLFSEYGYTVLEDFLRHETDLLARYADYEAMEDVGELSTALDIYSDDTCVTADTEVPFLDGTIRTVGELYEKQIKGEWVYGFDAEAMRTVACLFEGVAKISEGLPVLKVTFQDKQGHVGWLKVTAGHKFLMSSGHYREAGELKVGDSLMALFKAPFGELNKYEGVLTSPFKRQWQYAHRMVLESLGVLIPKGYAVHHKDHNGLNNHPDNLLLMPAEEHRKLHARPGALNHKFNSEARLQSLFDVLQDGYISKKEAGRRMGVGYRVVERLACEAGFESWGDIKKAWFGLDRRSRGHASKPETLEKRRELLGRASSYLVVNPDTSWCRMCEVLECTQGTLEEALKGIGKRWSVFKTDATQGKARVLHNDVVISIEPAGVEPIYDLVNSMPTHNFAAGHDGRWVFIKNTQPDLQRKKSVWVESKDKKVVDIINDMFKNLSLEDKLPGMARILCKYGSDFTELLITENGVIGLNPLDPPNMRRIEGPKSELMGFIQDLKGRVGYTTQDFRAVLEKRQLAMMSGQNAVDSALTPFEPFDVIHNRIQLKSRRSVYGQSVLEASRFIWKRLFLLEDSALYYRLRTAPERYAFYVDVGNLPPNEARAELARFRQEFSKRKFVNPANGKMDMRFEALVQDEHFYLPVRNGAEAVRVETLGSPSWQCLTGDTQIPLLDGTSPTIKELSTRNEDFWVYSVTPEGRMVPGRGHSARVTHQAAEIWEVELDNGRVVRCTDNHPFMKRDGAWSRADALQVGDSLMPLYRKLSSKEDGDYLHGYERVYDPETSKFVYTHHRVYQEWNQSESRRQQMSGDKHPRYRALTVADLGRKVQETGASTKQEFCEKTGVSTNLITRILREAAISWKVFAAYYIPGWVAKGRAAGPNNHKVVAVRKTGVTEPVYDLTVEGHHNFAVGAGVIVHNSVDDIEMFRDKLFAALKIPKSYFGQEDAARQVLSSQDVRFARTILRIQKEMKRGLYQLCDTHLAALGYDPVKVKYELHMTTPSSIYELAQLEVWNARADLAQRADGFVSKHWILSDIFRFTDSEIKDIFKQRGEDTDRQAEDQARSEAIVQQSAAEVSAATQQAFPPPPEEGGAPPAEIQPTESRLILPKSIRQRMNNRPVRGATDQELMEGSRPLERKLNAQLETILANDKKLSNRMGQLFGLLQDLRASTANDLRDLRRNKPR